MPAYSRRSLRRLLGTDYLRDTVVGKTTGSWGATASLTLLDASQADLTLDGESLYERAVARVWYNGQAYQDARVATFNTGSGAFLCLVAASQPIASGADYEVHSLLPPAEKDRCLDHALQRIPVSAELRIDSVEGALVYSLGPEVQDVYDVRFRPDPAQDASRALAWWKVASTYSLGSAQGSGYSGQELRVWPATSGSGELLLEARLTATWHGAADGDLQVIDLPSDDAVLAGAAAHAYWLLERRAPSQEVKVYQQARLEMMQTFKRTLLALYQPPCYRKVQLDDWGTSRAGGGRGGWPGGS